MGVRANRRKPDARSSLRNSYLSKEDHARNEGAGGRVGQRSIHGLGPAAGSNGPGRRLTKAMDDLDNNKMFVSRKFRSELGFLRDGLDIIGGSALEQRLLAENLQELIELDDDVSKRYRW